MGASCRSAWLRCSPARRRPTPCPTGSGRMRCMAAACLFSWTRRRRSGAPPPAAASPPAPAVAVGSVSGRLEGRIKALFYRYKSLGGYDYVSDFLIAPRALGDAANLGAPQTQPGDSGAVWHLVTSQPKTREAKDWREADD